MLTACAVMPLASYPPHVESDYAVRCIVPESGRLRVPATSIDLVVRSLTAEPPARGETFGANGERWLLFDAGTRVLLRARIRAYGEHERTGWFPDAVEWLDQQ